MYIGAFHALVFLFGTIGKMTRDSGTAELVIESEMCTSRSLDKIINENHHNNHVFHEHKLERKRYNVVDATSVEEQQCA